MPQADIQRILKVDKNKLFEVITKYEHYPDFVSGVDTTEIEERKDGRTVVKYTLTILGKEVVYRLNHEEDLEKGSVQWSLIESNLMKQNRGSWKIKDLGDGTCDVSYDVEIDFTIRIPGFILKRLVKGSLPSMIESFEARARG